MIPPGQLTGAVLAGGQSRRMGRDKASLMVEADPLWRRQVRLLRTAGATAVGVVRQAGQPALPLPPDVSRWHDSISGAGPLAGVQAALTACPGAWLAVVAVDLPRLDAGWFRWLAESCGPGRGAIAQRSDGSFEALAAIYPKAALPEINARLRGTDLSLQSLAGALIAGHRLTVVALPDADLWRVENWNTPADAGSGPDAAAG